MHIRTASLADAAALAAVEAACFTRMRPLVRVQ